ncbi:uncharacterized protein LOC121725375 [Aricia agestis]|uniref:uncharacterized protein LOC121725375 n=1 Tax=Aricia agestis TaxID=91739 RepID=UPI001C20C2C0|nr:uncharacterized protein LOC121725375 [Aricia agestis]
MTTYMRQPLIAGKTVANQSSLKVDESRSRNQIPQLKDDATSNISATHRSMARNREPLSSPASDEATTQPCRCRPTERHAVRNQTETYANLRQILAVVVPPIMNMNPYRNITSSNQPNTRETLYSTMEAAFYRIWGHLLQFLRYPDGRQRQLFALAIDVVVIIYCFGFLLLAMYEAAVIGQ